MPKHNQNYTDALQDQVGRILSTARQDFHRHCVVLCGDKQWCHNMVLGILKVFKLNSVLVVSTTKIPGPTYIQITPEESLQHLGREYEHAIMDLHDGIDPNALGAISGTISGGGILFLLLPPLDELPDFNDQEKQRMAIWPHDTTAVGNRFLHRLTHILLESNTIHLIHQNQPASEFLPAKYDKSISQDYLENEPCRTTEQRVAVAAIVHVAQGHRHRPLVLSANRGRGKSAALGIAAAQLMKDGNKHIIVTGPRFNAVAMVFEHAQRLLPDSQYSNAALNYNNSRLEYCAPDVLCDQQPECNLLLVDEAAAIPTPVLERLLNRYARIAFATTTYGYEGTGRGFTIKFQDILNRKTPDWQYLEMELPVRWAPHDPLEDFIFHTLCLDASVPMLDATDQPVTATVDRINRDALATDEETLSSIFGLLVLAHYQTQPRDLRYLLDAIGLDIFVARSGRQIIAAAVVEQEGGLDETTAEAVYRNERRVHGHLLAQTMESFAGVPSASRLKYLRIVRIVVHPARRRRGVAHQLLDAIEAFAKTNNIDILGSNFGASTDLLEFWHHNHYVPVHLGFKRNTSTGSHAITYLKPVSKAGETIVARARKKFVSQFAFQLTETYSTVDQETVDTLLKMLAEHRQLTLDRDEWQDIESFARALRGYEFSAPSINKLVAHAMLLPAVHNILTVTEKALLISKVLQQHSWQAVVHQLGLTGKSQAIQLLRTVVDKMVSDTSISSSIKLI